MAYKFLNSVLKVPESWILNPGIVISKRYRHEVSKAIIHATCTLEDGSQFISRVPLNPIKPTMDQLPSPIHKTRNLLSATRLFKQQIDEMRQLRLQDPELWTILKLSQKFNCSQYFVKLTTRVPDSYVPAILERKKNLWDSFGFKRQLIHINRLRRRALW